MKNAIAVSISRCWAVVKAEHDRATRWFLGAVFAIIAIGLMTYIALQLRAVYEIQADTLRLQRELSDLHGQVETNQEQTTLRMLQMESAVYDYLEPQVQQVEKKLETGVPPRRVSLTALQMKRDYEFKDRLTRLERWRLEHIEEKD